MDDLISRQAAIDAVCKCTNIYVTNLPVMVDKADAYKALAELPSAHSEIIRCKNCVNREVCRTTNIWAEAPDDDWFCGDARRENDE